MTPCNGCSVGPGTLCRSCTRSAPVLVRGYCGPCGATQLAGVRHFIGGGMLAVRTRARAEEARQAQEIEDALLGARRRSRRNAAMVKSILAKLGVDHG